MGELLPLYPVIKLRAGKDEVVRRFHPWIFSGAIGKVSQRLQAGDIVTVTDYKDEILGTGFCETGSIAVKLLSFENTLIDSSFWKTSLEKCLTMRESLGLLNNKHTNCYRLVHSEGDNLPGLIIDIYGNTAVIQAHTEGMALHINEIAETLKSFDKLNITSIYNKSASTMLRMGKDAIDDGYLWGESDVNYVLENDARFLVDCEEGQKTGFFLDQRNSRNLVGMISKDKTVLNTFCYTGGFSVMALKGGAKKVVSIDSSKKAIETCQKNLVLNGFSTTDNPCVVEDAKIFLTNMPDKQYDIIILDPPAFAKNHKSLHNGLLGYKFINKEAISKIKPGGLLLTFSCSQAVDKMQFQSVILSASIETGRNVRIINQLSQPEDHPINIYHPEGNYLKGLVLIIE